MSIAVGPTSLDLPAWVQAIGSVAAILAAVFIARRQSQQQEAARAGESKAALDREIAARARFLQMVVLQIKEVDELADRIAEEEQAVTRDSPRPPAGWGFWGKSRLDDFIENGVERLERIGAIPLEHWPDIESALIFSDALRAQDDDFRYLKEAARVPVIVKEEDQRQHWQMVLNRITELSQFLVYPFERFIRLRDEAVAEAKRREIDVRYAGRRAVDAQVAARRGEMESLKDEGNPRILFGAEVRHCDQLKQALRAEP